ncbi:hypothetical protein L1887_09997 [Cichorium endivia]|nr:hypothetical protein L1887_09997 [Cichorium endivia]
MLSIYLEKGQPLLKTFFEQSTNYKMQFYHREIGKGTTYSTYFDLYQSKAASWRDTLQARMAPIEPVKGVIVFGSKGKCGPLLSTVPTTRSHSGLTAHTDPCALTVLVQNEVDGLLQVKSGDDWVDVEAFPGAVVINIGDLLQMMSNDEYKSVEHRVLANPVEGAHVTVFESA